ncbi:hypothetical protein GCM10009753_58960 [Streptantibioticus ferralitis]
MLKDGPVGGARVVLLALVGELRSELTATRAELAAARAAIAELRAENAELKRRLGMNPKNSSKPPSSDGLAKPVSLRKSSGRGPGKAKGGAGGALLQVEGPDVVQVHLPAACGGCAGDLAEAEVVSVERRQVFDLPATRLRVTEHRLEHRRCACGQVTVAAAPDGAAALAQYGPQIKSLAVYLLTRQHLPYERCALLLADVHGAEVATCTLLEWAGQAAQAVAPRTEVVREQLIECDVVGFDETGTRIAGRTCWVHTACTPSLTMYHVHAKRGVAAIESMGVLPAFAGIAVHDRWKPYKTYTGAQHALWAAHHLRELTAVAENAAAQRPEAWAAELAKLLVDTWDEIKEIRAAHPEATGFTVDALERLTARYEEIFTVGRMLHPPRDPAAPDHTTKSGEPAGPPGRRARSSAPVRVRLARAVRQQRQRADDQNGEDPAEDLRRLAHGTERFFAVRGCLSTAAKQSENLLDAITLLFDGRGAWIPTPAS